MSSVEGERDLSDDFVKAAMIVSGLLATVIFGAGVLVGWLFL